MICAIFVWITDTCSQWIISRYLQVMQNGTDFHLVWTSENHQKRIFSVWFDESSINPTFPSAVSRTTDSTQSIRRSTRNPQIKNNISLHKKNSPHHFLPLYSKFWSIRFKIKSDVFRSNPLLSSRYYVTPSSQFI